MPTPISVAILALLTLPLTSSALNIAAYVTYGNQTRLLEQANDLLFTPVSSSNLAQVVIDPSKTYQEILGFGAALTWSSAYVMSTYLSQSQQTQLLEELFNVDVANFASNTSGIGLNFLRYTIGASDFSQYSYTYDDMPAGQEDIALQHFSMKEDEAVLLPMLRRVYQVQPNTLLMGTPWSPPAWMKNNTALSAGTLRPDAYKSYAYYFARFVQNMKKSTGANVDYITVQNEPLYPAPSYPSMVMEPEQQAQFIAQALGPMLRKEAPNTKILIYDHNWDRPDYPISVLSQGQAAEYVHGSAFHCYGGNVDAMSQVHDRFPQKDIFFTECSGGQWAPVFSDNLVWNAKTLIVGNLRNWATNVLFWNLALDENAGPTNHGCLDCRGVVTVDSRSSTFSRNVEYYVLGHASKFISRGAVRVASKENQALGLHHVAVRNPDGSIVLIVVNEQTYDQRFQVSLSGERFGFTLGGSSVVTFVVS